MSVYSRSLSQSFSLVCARRQEAPLIPNTNNFNHPVKFPRCTPYQSEKFTG